MPGRMLEDVSVKSKAAYRSIQGTEVQEPQLVVHNLSPSWLIPTISTRWMRM
jgi:hypothetical protein